MPPKSPRDPNPSRGDGNRVFTTSGFPKRGVLKYILHMRFLPGLRRAVLVFGGGLLLTLHAEDPLPSADRLKSSPVLRHLKPNPMATAPRTGPEQTVAQMHVPEGFRVDVVVAEPELHQPVAFAWDELGRLWVAEAYSYPTKRAEGQGLDKLVIFSDTDGNGSFETRKVFAEGLNLVSGFEVGFGGVWVGAAPQLLFIPDRDRNDVPDGPPEVLLDGFGFQDTHECLNSFLWGPDGWLYGNQGVFNLAYIGKPGAPAGERVELRAGVWRYHPVRREFEVYAHGGSNPWGLDYDERGQFFMTHCRSYWGRGLTTQVFQGGQFWNQANANYAPFIVAEPPADFPSYRNYLLASARYDHGAGGAGERGSDAIYGGHSHVGTMIYLGDNWPEEYRGRLFTHNLGGHQMNQQVNVRLGSGFNTVHAGRDLLFCTDPKYVAVDLQYGPDGAVYFIDWYDQQHCHNPNTERWDRSNGRMYRLQWQATYRPVQVNLRSRTDQELVELQRHSNEWYGRTARRLLQERSATGERSADAMALASRMLTASVDSRERLRGAWTLNALGALTPEIVERALQDPDEFVRGWAVALATDRREASASELAQMVTLARVDPSPVVRRYLASALQRVPEQTAWALASALAQHGEDRDDRNLPGLLWSGLAPRIPGHQDEAVAFARQTQIPQLADWTWWYLATLGGPGLDAAVADLQGQEGETLRRRLAGIGLALEVQANVPRPSSWSHLAPSLYANKDARIQRQAERIAGVLGDDSMFPRLRQVLGDVQAPLADRKHAFAVLSRGPDRASLPVFLGLLDDSEFRSETILLLARFDSPDIAPALLQRWAQWTPKDRALALGTLTRRSPLALALLQAVSSGQVKRDELSAFHVRALTDLKNPEIDRQVTATWGRILPSPAEKQSQIGHFEKVFQEAPLWAFSAREGKAHFQKLCASCHKVGEEGIRLGPELTGAGKHGIRYFLENVLDPNAVIGADFQLTTVETKSGDLLSGIIVSETPSAVSLRTTAETVVVAKSEIQRRETTEKSLMPEGLLESLNDREQIELLKFLVEN